MTDAGGAPMAEFEALLASALRPVEPPETLVGRFEETLSRVSQTAASELTEWAEELSESELESLRDPRNWVRPVVAIAAGGVATGALVLIEMRRHRRSARGERALQGLRRLVRD
jgi:hypothetical protein